MKKLEQMLAAMRPKMHKYAMGGSVANEPQQWTSQQKSLMGNQGKKKGYNDIINDYHTPAGSAYRFTNPSAPIPFDAEKRFKQNVGQNTAVMGQNMALQDQTHRRDIEDFGSIAGQKTTELANQYAREAYDRAKRGEEYIAPKIGKDVYKDIINIKPNTSPYAIQGQKDIIAGKKPFHKDPMAKYHELQSTLKDQQYWKDRSEMLEMSGRQQAQLNDFYDLLKNNVDEQGNRLSPDDIVKNYERSLKQKYEGENEKTMTSLTTSLKSEYQQQLDEAKRKETERERAFQAQLGGYQGWKSPQQVEQELAAKQVDLTKYKPLAEYKTLEQQLAAKANLAYTPQQYQQAIQNTQNQYAGYLHPSQAKPIQEYNALENYTCRIHGGAKNVGNKISDPGSLLHDISQSKYLFGNNLPSWW